MTLLDRPIPESYWVVPGRFLAGEYPGHYEEKARQRMDAFLAAGFDTFIDLTRPDEVLPYEPLLREQAGYYGLDLRYLRFPIGDFGVPEPEQMKAALDAIDIALAEGHKVYLHCRAGLGRTGTTIGCYLVRHGRTGEEALRQLAEWCPRSPETPQQEQFILDWHEPRNAASPDGA